MTVFREMDELEASLLCVRVVAWNENSSHVGPSPRVLLVLLSYEFVLLRPGFEH